MNDVRIMLVDDDTNVLAAIKDLLTTFGYTVYSYSSPMSAFNAIKNNPSKFTIIFTDFNMPGLNGIQLIERIKKIVPDMKTIICTGYIDLINQEYADKLGVDYIIPKPVFPDDMINKINALFFT